MEKNCKFCTKKFEAKRSTADFCSTNCRVKWNNKKAKTPDNFGLIVPRVPVTNFDGSLKRPDKKFEYVPPVQINEEPKSAAAEPAVKVAIKRGAYISDAIKKKLGL